MSEDLDLRFDVFSLLYAMGRFAYTGNTNRRAR